jgi:hypothetical protein
VLLDIWSVLGGIGLAAVAFIVVILVCVVILRLLAAILPSYEDRATPAAAAGHGVPEDSSGEAPEPRVEEEAGALDGNDEAAADGAKQAPAPDEAAPI